MMDNKWVQGACLVGLSFGILLGGLISLFYPLVPFIFAALLGLLSLWMVGMARGTDGWKGPFNRP